jgi:hypothetical protein
MHPQLAKIIGQLQYDPEATRSFDLMSGAFLWSDERPEIDSRQPEHSMVVINLLRKLFAYRASLILDSPRSEFAELWEEVRSVAPDWPGFRSERRSTELREPLQIASDEMLQQLDRLERVCDRLSRRKDANK